MATIPSTPQQQQPPLLVTPQQPPAQAPAQRWDTQLDFQAHHDLDLAGDLQVQTVAFPTDAANNAKQSAALQAVHFAGKKCGRVYDVMTALKEGPKTRTQMMDALGYTNAGTHYQANPIKALKEEGYVITKKNRGRGNNTYMITAHFAFGLH